jgi:hypothetical protein
MCHDSSLPAFFRVKAKMALPDLMAAWRSAGEAEREAWMASKAAEEGKSSRIRVSDGGDVGCVVAVAGCSSLEHAVAVYECCPAVVYAADFLWKLQSSSIDIGALY